MQVSGFTPFNLHLSISQNRIPTNSRIRECLIRPVPHWELSPGIVNRLIRDGVVQVLYLLSPDPRRSKCLVAHLQITEAGRAAVTG